MKNVKQKQQTLQEIINAAQTGGGGGDSYTKAEADAKFQTKEDMTDYLEEKTGGYFVVNSIRVYVSATQPADAPTGSIWIGG